MILETNLRENSLLIDLLEKYCSIDTHLLIEIIKIFIKNYKRLFSTIPKLRIFITAPKIREFTFINKNSIRGQKYYNQNEIQYINPKRHRYKFIKNGYFGGRREVFKAFTNKKYRLIFDINSAYGNAIKLPMPVGIGIINTLNITSKDEIGIFIKIIQDKQKIGFLSCDIRVERNIKYPILPTKQFKEVSDQEIDLYNKDKKLVIIKDYDRNGKLLFPTGQIKGI
jgi:hypothetical protein